MTLAGFLGGVVFGVVVAGLFDWCAVYLMNPWRLQTPKERRQATLLAFAVHGPWLGLGAALFTSGVVASGLQQIGVPQEASGVLSLPVYFAIGGAAIWLTHQLPPVREARGAVRDKIRAAHADNNRLFGRLLGMPAQTPPDPAPEPEKPPVA